MAARRTILWVGDSITEGFSDNMPVSCYGLPGRFQRDAMQAATVIRQHLNLGCSGSLVGQYIDIAKQWISATPDSITVCVVSVWSPNIPSGEGFSWAYDAANLSDMRDELQAFEPWLLERSKVFVPAFIAGSPLGQDDGTQVRLQAHREACAELWPWMLDFNDAIQDPAKPLGPWMLMPTYCGDATHPNADGYDKMYADHSASFESKVDLAIAAYGFVEP